MTVRCPVNTELESSSGSGRAIASSLITPSGKTMLSMGAEVYGTGGGGGLAAGRCVRGHGQLFGSNPDSMQRERTK